MLAWHTRLPVEGNLTVDELLYQYGSDVQDTKIAEYLRSLGVEFTSRQIESRRNVLGVMKSGNNKEITLQRLPETEEAVKTRALEGQILSLKHKNSATNQTLRRVVSEVFEDRTVYDDLGEAIEDGLQQYRDLSNFALETLQGTCVSGSHKEEMFPVLLLGDWHTGLVVSPSEVEYRNEYNYDIQTKRIISMVAKFIKTIHAMRSDYQIDELNVIELGDSINGEIHEEYLLTNEFPLPIQIQKAATLRHLVLSMLINAFTKVNVHALASSNHNRKGKQVYYNNRSLHSWGILEHFINKQLFIGNDKVFYNIIEPIRDIVTIGTKRILIEHGNDIRSFVGHPVSGLQRVSQMEAISRMNTSLQFNYHVIAHFHSPDKIGNQIINGALCGTTPFDITHRRFSKPAQCALYITEKDGIMMLQELNGDI